jgi:hypothetical protein
MRLSVEGLTTYSAKVGRCCIQRPNIQIGALRDTSLPPPAASSTNGVHHERGKWWGEAVSKPPPGGTGEVARKLADMGEIASKHLK